MIGKKKTMASRIIAFLNKNPSPTCCNRCERYLGGHFQEEMEGCCVHFFVHGSINGGPRMGQLRAKGWFIVEVMNLMQNTFNNPFGFSVQLSQGFHHRSYFFLTPGSLGTYLGPLDLLGPSLSSIPVMGCVLFPCAARPIALELMKSSWPLRSWKGFQMWCANRYHCLHICSSSFLQDPRRA